MTIGGGAVHCVIGGIGAEGVALGTVEAYDPLTDSWAALAPTPTPRYALAAATAADGRIYVMGGLSVARALQTVESFDPSTNSWSTAAPMPTARFGLGAAAGVDGRIYAIGGADEATVHHAAEV